MHLRGFPRFVYGSQFVTEVTCWSVYVFCQYFLYGDRHYILLCCVVPAAYLMHPLILLDVSVGDRRYKRIDYRPWTGMLAFSFIE